MGLLFISPWIIGVAAFVIYPLVYSFAISLTQYSGMQTPTFIGLQNYISAFLDPLVRTSVGNTVYYMLVAVPLGLVVALLLALAMNRNVREVAVYRTLLYLPSLIPMFAMSFIFIVFVNPQFGIVNQILGLFGMPDTNLLGEPRYAKIVIILMAQLAAGNAALIYLAGLRNIPSALYEAARIDGAGRMKQFTAITLPLLTPTILFNLITGVSGAMMVFTEAYIMTDGGRTTRRCSTCSTSTATPSPTASSASPRRSRCSCSCSACSWRASSIGSRAGSSTDVAAG